MRKKMERAGYSEGEWETNKKKSDLWLIITVKSNPNLKLLYLHTKGLVIKRIFEMKILNLNSYGCTDTHIPTPSSLIQCSQYCIYMTWST